MTTFKQMVVASANSQMVRTENGMPAHATTANPVLDLFFLAGSSRGQNINPVFHRALAHDVDLTIRLMLWMRDIRGGAGEREQFRRFLVELERVQPAICEKVLPLIPVFGRWDDIIHFNTSHMKDRVAELVKSALLDRNALCAKWMPREKSANSRIAKDLYNRMGWSAHTYRKTLSYLTNVVENRMCANQWTDINYAHVPSVASARYQKAFGRHDPEGYGKYIQALQKGETKINAGAVYPYDITKSVTYGDSSVADQQWKALPDFVKGKKILPMVDVSGSMFGARATKTLTAGDIAISLGLYLSERASDAFKDVFMTFSSEPEFNVLKGTLYQRVSQLKKAKWKMSTNVEAAFNLLLSVAKEIDQSEMPDVLLILSDMQFNQCVYPNWNMKIFTKIQRDFENIGMKMPKLVFWNLSMAGKQDSVTAPVQSDECGTALVSGFSPSIMKAVLSDNLETFTPLNVMMETLMNDRYNWM